MSGVPVTVAKPRAVIPARTVDPALVDAAAAGTLPPEHPASASVPSARTGTLDKACFTGDLRSVAGASRTIRNDEKVAQWQPATSAEASLKYRGKAAAIGVFVGRAQAYTLVIRSSVSRGTECGESYG